MWEDIFVGFGTCQSQIFYGTVAHDSEHYLQSILHFMNACCCYGMWGGRVGPCSD